MNPPAVHPPADLDHVLILAPYRRDADYLRRLLAENEIAVAVGSGDADITERLEATPGVLVTTNEAVTPAILEKVGAFLRSQPDWSELPIIVLLDRAAPGEKVAEELARSWPRSRQMFYQRPVASMELLSGVQSTLLARRRQRDVRDHIAREIELRRELNHRVKNILASVTSIFEMTRRGAPDIETLTEDFRGRLGALAQVHSAVFESDGHGVAFTDIVELTFKPYAIEGQNRILTDGPPLTLAAEAGTTLALCLHELTTNAIKYGALSRPEGQVDFRWSVDKAEEGDVLSLVWQERGGPQVEEPARLGYGTRYLRSSLTALFGRQPRIAFDRQGLVCEAAGPLSRVASNS